jgi:hypothetical protein
MNLSQVERLAIEAVALHVAGTWEKCSRGAAAYLLVGGKRIAIDITTLKRRGAAPTAASKPRLRFDRVATRLMQRLRDRLDEDAPDGTSVLLTITAPIRLPAKTAAALEDKIRARLRRGTAGRDEKDVIHGNQVRIRLLRDESGRAPGLIGLAHNSDSAPLQLLNTTQQLLEQISAKAGAFAPQAAAERWLVVISAQESSWLEAYRSIYAQSRYAAGFGRILVVFGDGRIGILAE